MVGINAAALTGCGQGEDATKTDDVERTRWRRQALDWLQTDLTVWKKQMASQNPKVRDKAEKALQDWLRDPDLAGVRDAKALDRLPEQDKNAWRRLWADIEVLLKQNGGKARHELETRPEPLTTEEALRTNESGR